MNELSYSSQPFIELVGKYTDKNGNVDYASWQQSAQDLRVLSRQVDLLAQISPDNRPELFPDNSAKRSYWINAYNTLVLRAVLEVWPLESVRDVKVSMTSKLVPGKGFFYDREVVVGGLKTNLFKFENNVIRKQIHDPRIHFALNCASGSCPILRPSDWSEDDLEAATRDFINNPDNVSVKDGKVWLSRIFKWYKKDFPNDLYGYFQAYAENDLHRQLEIAVNQKYGRKYFAYGWELNDAGATNNS